jgi:transcription initiation factor TFIIIB Brf1 subunit/transcription initiation factor TFIIB
MTSVEVADSTDQQLVDLLSRMDKVGSVLGTGADERDQAAEMLIDAWEQRLLEGRSVDTAVGVCWYITLRKQHEPRPLGVVADAVGVTDSEIHSFRRTATDELDISLNIARPSEYLRYVRTQLDLSVSAEEKAEEILQNACVPGDPAGIAAGGLYVAAHNLDEAVTMREAAQAVRLSKETIWQRVDDLRDQQQ